MTHLEGVDVSEANGSVDWKAVHGSGRRFAICKVSEGTYLDPTFSRSRVDAIRKAGLIAGGYAYLRPRLGRTGAQEASGFLRHAKAAGLWHPDHQTVKDVRPVLDLEESGFHVRGRARTLRYLESAVEEVMRQTGGRRPILYLGSFWRDELRDPRTTFGGCPLWYPEYGVSRPRLAPRAWAHGPAIWQYSENGRVPGVPGDCDLDRYLDGDLRHFKARMCI